MLAINLASSASAASDMLVLDFASSLFPVLPRPLVNKSTLSEFKPVEAAAD